MLTESYIALALLGSLLVLVVGLEFGSFINWLQDFYWEHKERDRAYRRALRRNIHQLVEAISEEDPEEMTDPMLREALAATIAEHRNL